MSVKIHSEEKQSLLGRATAFFVYLFEKVMPDPFVFAVILTFVGALLALWFAPNATLPSVASAWYGGIFAIFAFAFQMVLMLVAGYALASARAPGSVFNVCSVVYGSCRAPARANPGGGPVS